MKKCEFENVEVNIGDIVQIGWDNNRLGIVTGIEDTIYAIRGYYNIYLDNENTYYRSDDIVAVWNKKEVIEQETELNDINPKYHKDIREICEKVFKDYYTGKD